MDLYTEDNVFSTSIIALPTMPHYFYFLFPNATILKKKDKKKRENNPIVAPIYRSKASILRKSTSNTVS
jgi:hypothetical protein